MTLLKVPFVFPKYFFCSQQATFIKVGKGSFCSLWNNNISCN